MLSLYLIATLFLSEDLILVLYACPACPGSIIPHIVCDDGMSLYSLHVLNTLEFPCILRETACIVDVCFRSD